MLQALPLVARQIRLAYHRWRQCAASSRPMLVELSLQRERVQRLEAEIALLRARMARARPRRLPHYTAIERIDILWHAKRYGLAVPQLAHVFVVAEPTVKTWRRDLRRGEERLVRTQVPVNKLPDFIAEIARRLRYEFPRWGTRRIAGILARLGIEASRSSVQAFLRRGPLPPACVEPRHPCGPRVVAKHPGHVWLIDFSRVGTCLRSVVFGAVLDAFSRKTLALAVAPREPTAAFAVSLVEQAIQEHGEAPAWLVTDKGRQFTAAEFGRANHRFGIRRRFGRVGAHGSIALLERFWKSFKTEYARGLTLYRPLRAIRRDALRWIHWYNGERPNQGLDQRTPDEVHFGIDTRARLVPLEPRLVMRLLDGDRTTPVVSLRRAA